MQHWKYNKRLPNCGWKPKLMEAIIIMLFLSNVFQSLYVNWVMNGTGMRARCNIAFQFVMYNQQKKKKKEKVVKIVINFVFKCTNNAEVEEKLKIQKNKFNELFAKWRLFD